MPAVYEHLHIVHANEIDRLGHVNNVEYLRWMMTAALAHSGAQGWGPDEYDRLGAGFVVRSHQIKYLQSAMLGDELTVRTWVSDFKRMSSTRQYKIFRCRDEALLASATTEWAFVDFANMKLARIPPQVAEAFEIHAVV